MKKLWKRFKHWLIKKLGGYVAPTKELEIAHYTVEPIAVFANLFIDNARLEIPKDDNRHMIKRLDDIDLQSMIEERLARQLAIEIVKQDLFEVQKMEGRPMFDETCFRAVALVLPPKLKWGKRLGYTGTPCPNCGRYRLERYENGKEVCEKCEWCPQEGRYIDRRKMYPLEEQEIL